MNCRGGLLRRAPLHTACLAASRFAAHRARSSPHLIRTWRPVTLRWRQARRLMRLPQGPAMRAASGATWLLQSHRYIIERSRRRSTRARSRGVFRVAAIRERRRIVVERNRRGGPWMIATLAQRPLHFPRLQFASTQVGVAPRVHARTTLPTFAARSRACIPVRSRAARAESRLRQPRSSGDPRAIAVTVPHFPSIDKHRLAEHHQTRAPHMHRRPTIRGSLVWRIPDSARSPRTRDVQPARLIWQAAATSTGAPRGTPVTRSSAVRTDPPSGSLLGDPVSSATPRHAPSAPVRLKDLDPGVLDRLTDDVIRRVERRDRIERERRGA
jgi:hypothetical protein